MRFESIDNGRAYDEHAELLAQFREIRGVTDVSSNVHLNSFWLTFGEGVERVNTEVAVENGGHDVEVVIKNITASVQKQGMGGEVVRSIISWAHLKGWTSIIARDVDPDAKEFWSKQGFKYDERPENVSNDWLYQQ